MTVFSTRCCKNRLECLLRALLLACACASVAVHAGEIVIQEARFNTSEEGYALDADFKFELTPRLEEAVEHGVTLYFVAEFEVTRPRWYWLDEKIVIKSQTWRLNYHALTRQYRLSTGGLYQNFSSLGDA